MLASLVLFALQQAAPPPAPAPDPLADFLKQVNEATERLKPVKAGFKEAMTEGRVAEFVGQLQAAIPAEGRAPAHDYAIASLVFDLDATASMALHQRAHEGLPDNPLVQFEWALELHRAGRLAEAEAVYAKIPRANPVVPASIDALHAETLARLGRYEEAIAMWQRIDLAADREVVEQSLSWVHAPPSPWVRRAALIARVAKGEASAGPELLRLDLEFDTNPLRTQVRSDLVPGDLARLRAAPHADAAQIAILEAITRLQLALAAAHDAIEQEEDVEPAVNEGRQAAQAAHLVGEHASLPADSRLAADAMGPLVFLELATPAELLAGFGDELWARARSSAGDANAAGVLADLCESLGDERVAEALELGWRGAHDADCIARRLQLEDSLKPDDPRLADALQRHPEDAHLLTIAVMTWVDESVAPPASLVTRMLVASTRELLDVELIDSTYGLLELADSEK